MCLFAVSVSLLTFKDMQVRLLTVPHVYVALDKIVYQINKCKYVCVEIYRVESIQY